MSAAFPEECSTCRFWLAGTTLAKVFAPAGGMCRRRAPTGPAVMPSSGAWQSFPPMTSGQWCGEYEQDHEAYRRWVEAREEMAA